MYGISMVIDIVSNYTQKNKIESTKHPNKKNNKINPKHTKHTLTHTYIFIIGPNI